MNVMLPIPAIMMLLLAQDPAVAPPPPSPVAVIPGQAATALAPPTTAQEVAAIRSMRSELSNQLNSAAGRRRQLAEQLKDAAPEARPGLEARIAVLDERIVQLESDIAETGRFLTSLPAGLVASTRTPTNFPGNLGPDHITGISVVFTIFVLFPLAIAAARLMWRRAKMPVRPALPADAGQRLERIEQSVDAVAIEVERVTEGQRFLTKLLTDAKAPPALPAGHQAETIHVRREGS